MLKRIRVLFFIVAAALVMSSCSGIVDPGSSGTGETNVVPSGKTDTSADVLNDPENDSNETTDPFTLTPSDGAKDVEVSGSVYKISGSGEYIVAGKLENGQILVEAGDEDEVKIILKNASITNLGGAAISAKNADKVTVSAEKDTYNVITDGRTGDADALPNSEENEDAAIYACCDLTIAGKGTLIVNGSFDNGIKTKDDLTVKNLTLKVTARSNALKGNDSVTIKSGEIKLISTSSDGVKTKNSGISEKGNQKGIVSIEGGHVDIYSACDGISAAYDVLVSESDTETVLNIFTANYSESTGTVSAGSELYLILPTTVYSKNSDYYAYFYNDSGEGTYAALTYETMVRSGRTSYYGLVTKYSGSYSKVIFLATGSGSEPDKDSATLKSSGESVNTAMNAYLVSGTSSLDGEWVQLSKNDNGSGKTAYSSKGIKAENKIEISGGTVTVKSMDDGIHANADTTLENGSKATGAISITGGSVTITAADDGMHADGKLTISGGYVNVAQAHEGLEGNVVTVAGGETYVYGNDDGINACKGTASTPMICIKGGYLEVRTPTGDTDGIDSNGSFEMTGGTVLVMGGASQGTMAGSVDVERSLTVTGGTIIAFGGVCETPESGSVNTYIGSGSFGEGDYVLSAKGGSEIMKFKVTGSYSTVWIASDNIALNGDYTMTNGTETVLSWTQTSQTVGSGGGGFNPGGFGPGGRR